MAARKLRANVILGGVLYGPDGEQPSAEVAKEITNPKAWEGGKLPEAEDEGPAYPEGEPSEDWTGKQLDAYASDKGVDLGGAKTKAEKVAAIQTAAASGSGDGGDEPGSGSDSGSDQS